MKFSDFLKAPLSSAKYIRKPAIWTHRCTCALSNVKAMCTHSQRKLNNSLSSLLLQDFPWPSWSRINCPQVFLAYFPLFPYSLRLAQKAGCAHFSYALFLFAFFPTMYSPSLSNASLNLILQFTHLYYLPYNCCVWHFIACHAHICCRKHPTPLVFYSCFLHTKYIFILYTIYIIFKRILYSWCL